MLTTTNLSMAGRLRRAGAVLAAAALLAACTPPGPRALLDGERLLQEGRPVDAIRRLRTAVEFLPNDAQAWNHLGLAYHAARQPTEAAEAYQQAVRVNRNLTAGYFNLGCLLLEQGDYARAADTLRTHVGLDPQSVNGWKRLAQAQLRLRQWELAERSLASAQRLAPEDPEILNATGVAQQQRRRYREAWQSFNTVVSRQPNFAPAWLNLAVAAHQAGAKTQAAQAYRRYASLRPDQARVLGLPTLIASLEGPPPAPVAPPAAAHTLPSLVASNAAATAAAPAPRPATNAPPSRTAPAPAAAQTNPPAAPAQRNPPPRRAAADPSPSNPTNANPSPAPIVAQSPKPSPPPVLPLPRVSAPAPAPETAARTDPKPGSTLSTGAVANSASPSVATATPPKAPEPAPAPLEVVEVAADSALATTVRDEPSGPATLPAAPTDSLASAPAAPASNAPPLIRPVAAQRNARSATPEKKGFWDRANPASWFGSEESLPDTNAPASTATADSSRWKWANPASWFRDEPGEGRARGGTNLVTGTNSGPTRLAAISRPAPAPPAASPTDAPGTNAPAAASTSSRPRPARREPDATADMAEPAPRDFKRYTYGRPAAPAAGDRAAAQPLLDQALGEHRSGRYARAVELYEEALKLDPAFSEAHQNLAAAALQEGDLPRALKAGETALALRPDSATARLNFSLALDRAGFAKDAAAEAERLVEARPDDASAHLLLGNLYAQRLADPGRARVHYQRLIELQPDHPQSAAIRRWLAGSRADR